ncbi:MAG: hypothetical protein Q8J85_07225 [Sulfuricurvum sp.]|nr:hypothetical protein [Sulfuricurvum sp.]MDP3022982.1 hypothetical protein [Sulfuricurvum sp.]
MIDSEQTFKSEIHKQNYYMLQRAGILEEFNGVNNIVRTLNDGTLEASSYKIPLLKIRYDTGAIYFNNKEQTRPDGKISKTSKRFQTHIKKWLDTNYIIPTQLEVIEVEPVLEETELEKLLKLL